MLFKTIYGPELASVFFYIKEYGPIQQSELFDAFGTISNNQKSSQTNLEDTLNFLDTTGLVKKNKKIWNTDFNCIDDITFSTSMLKKLRFIQVGKKEGHSNPLDPYFFGLIDNLFIQPDILFINDLHAKVNNLSLPLPCGEEKINAWRRIIEYLGLGTRGYGGLLLQYSTEVVLRVLNEWPEDEGPLQHFIEGHFDKYLPWKTKGGDIAKALAVTFEILEGQGKIRLIAKQDLPSKSYMGSRKIKWIGKEKEQWKYPA